MYDSAPVVTSATESRVALPRTLPVPALSSALAAAATIAVLALGIGLRIWRPDLAQTNFDESNVASLVAAWKFDGAFPLTGTVSSYDFRAGQGWPWFAAIGLLWTDDPYGLIAVGVAAGVAGFVACWWVARRWLGVWGGVAAGLFNGTTFYCVILARGAWQPAFLQAPMALCLDALLRLAVQRRPWALAVACAWLGVLVSVHYTSVVFALLLPFAAWQARGVLRPRHLLGAAVAGLLPLTPFLLYEVSPTVRLHELIQLLALSRGPSSIDLDTFSSTYQVTSTFGAAGLGGHSAADLANELGRWTNITLIGPPLAAIGLLVAVARYPRGAVGWLIAGWTMLPILFYLRHSAPVIFHYMYIEFPGVALSVGCLAAWAAHQRWNVVRVAVGCAIAACAAASTFSVLVLLHTVDTLDVSAGYGIPVGYTRQAGEVARRLMPAGGQILIGDDPQHGETLRFTVGYNNPSRTFDDCRGVPYAQNVLYLLSSEQTPGAHALDAAGASLLERIARPGGDAFRIYAAPPASTGINIQADPENPICQDRAVWDTP